MALKLFNSTPSKSSNIATSRAKSSPSVPHLICREARPLALRGPLDGERGPARGRSSGGSSWRGQRTEAVWWLEIANSLGNFEMFTNSSLDSDHCANVFSFCHFRPGSTGRERSYHWDCQHSTEPRVLRCSFAGLTLTRGGPAQAHTRPRHGGNWWPEKNTDGDYIRGSDIQWYQIITHLAPQWHPGMSAQVIWSRECAGSWLNTSSPHDWHNHSQHSGCNNCHTCYQVTTRLLAFWKHAHWVQTNTSGSRYTLIRRQQ